MGAPMIYTGPSTRLDPARLASLPASWACQPKLDGCYAVATLDPTGRIASVRSRTGRPLPEADELLGTLAGLPGSVLCGELEAHTETGTAAYARLGYRRLHLFDCLTAGGVSLRSAPYVERWGALHRMQSALEADAHEVPRDASGRRHDQAGRFSARFSLARLPIIPLVRGHVAARELWRDHVERDGGEGLVAVDLTAPAGRRGSKLKLKLTDTADCRILAVSPGLLRLAAPRTSPAGWRGGSFVLGYHRAADLAPGAIVEVAHDGCYRSGLPRFARVVRVRTDLATWRATPVGARSLA